MPESATCPWMMSVRGPCHHLVSRLTCFTSVHKCGITVRNQQTPSLSRLRLRMVSGTKRCGFRTFAHLRHGSAVRVQVLPAKLCGNCYHAHTGCTDCPRSSRFPNDRTQAVSRSNETRNRDSVGKYRVFGTEGTVFADVRPVEKRRRKQTLRMP